MPLTYEREVILFIILKPPRNPHKYPETKPFKRLYL